MPQELFLAKVRLVVCILLLGFGVISIISECVIFVQLKMAPTEAVVQATNTLSQFSNMLAADTDFGGYTGPIASLVFIGFIILTFAPPLAQKE